MHTAVAILCNIPNSFYSQSRLHEVPRLPKEKHRDHDIRTALDKLHADEVGRVYIPMHALKGLMIDVAGYLSESVPEKGGAKFTKHFTAGVQVLQPAYLYLPGGNPINAPDIDKDPLSPRFIRKESVPVRKVFCDSRGVRDGNKRVPRYFPVIEEWACVATFDVVDSAITPDVFAYHLAQAGKLIGLGRWRAKRGGQYGRFSVERLFWDEQEIPTDGKIERKVKKKKTA